MKYKVWHIERKEWIHDTWSIFIDPDGEVWEIEERGSYDRYMSKTWINEKVKVVYATGLQDKNGIHDLYEGDIIDVNGLKVGNVYETKNVHECTTNHIIAGMGTEKWKDTEHEAIKRGCFYAE